MRAGVYVLAFALLGCGLLGDSCSAQGVKPCSPLYLRNGHVDTVEFPDAGTRFHSSGQQYLQLTEGVRGLRLTGIPLVGAVNGTVERADCGDDPGLYYVIPFIVLHSRLSVADCLDLFVILLSVIPAAFAIIVMCVLLRRPLAKVYAVASIGLVAVVSVRIGGIYPIFPAAVFLLVPSILALEQRARHFAWRLCGFGLVALLAGMANEVRGYAGTTVVFFLLMLVVAGARYSIRQKLLLTGFVLLTLSLFPLWIRHVEARSISYVRSQNAALSDIGEGHPLWHTAYIAMAWVPNPYIPRYADALGAEKAAAARPGVPMYSAEYERILRAATIALVRDHPLLVIENLAEKIGMTAAFLLLVANAGFFLRVRGFARSRYGLAFLGAIGFEALFGIVAVPEVRYLLGAAAFTVLYGACAIDGERFRKVDVRSS